MMKHHLTIPPDLAGQRLDKALTQLLATEAEGVSRVRVQALLAEGHIQPANDPSSKATEGTVYEVTIPPAVPTETVAENIPLDIVYEDDDVLVLNKPAGLVVHPAVGNWQGTLVNALLWHNSDTLSSIGGEKRPGIVHRLDKETSGLMVVAKNDSAHQKLTAQFVDRSLSRTYLALVWGVPMPRTGRIDAQIGRDPKDRKRMAVVQRGGKEAITEYQIEKVLMAGQMSLLRCHLLTGRTHQIRVHMAHNHTPIVGDPIYGGRKKNKIEDFERQALHAAAIQFIHPRTDELMHFTAPLPEDFSLLLGRL